MTDHDYGISPDAYTFMPVQYFDEPVYEHYYPVAENRSYFGLTIGITRIVIRSGNVHCDGPERLWVNGRLSRPMTRYRLDRDYGYDDRHDYRPRFDNDRLSCYSPRVRTSWNEGLRPSRLHGRIDDIKVVRRQESFRGDLNRRYQEEQRERRGRATAALQQEPVRRLAERHGALEKVRSQRDQLTQRRGGSERSSSRQPALERSDRSDRVRGEGARQEVLQKERLETSRKDLKERQDEVTKLRAQVAEALAVATEMAENSQDPPENCNLCRHLGHSEADHPLPKDHPQYDAFYDASDDELSGILVTATRPGQEN